MVESFRKIPGKPADLPSFIHDRMVEMELRPTLTQLALGIGAPISSLRENLNGTKSMKLDTAIRIADFLKCDLTELVKNAGLR